MHTLWKHILNNVFFFLLLFDLAHVSWLLIDLESYNWYQMIDRAMFYNQMTFAVLDHYKQEKNQ